ncbi:MAG: OmpA family protein [bacterium]|nr:OmpA family protein [bacterium]MDE0239333.1 OmpA family protein [bacterium]MDE0419232.1 OmpA family protein [bacterium]
MSKISGTLFAGAVALLLAGCGTPASIDRVAGMATADDPFLQHLHAGYVDLARKESAYYDRIDAAAFRDRAEMVAEGVAVEPWDPTGWNIDSAEQLDLLVNERANLMAELEAGDRVERPEAAARAQTSFDCWVEEVEEGPVHPGPIASHQEAEIESCRDAFHAAMEELLYVAPEPEPEPVPEPAPQTDFVVYFAWNSPELSEIATGFLESVVAEAVRQQPSAIVISGHADTSGSSDFNMGLSRDRVEAVAAHVAAAGIDPSLLVLEWFGEALPAVDTGDGVRNQSNRRVEVRFE